MTYTTISGYHIALIPAGLIGRRTEVMRVARHLNVSAVAAFLVLVLPAFASAAERAPAPRPVFPRFDLSYLPKIGGQGIIAVRPSEIAQHATTAEVHHASQMVGVLYSQIFGAQELDLAQMPTFDKLQECVFCLQMRFTAPKGGERASFMFGGVTPGIMRTVEPFAWDRVFRKWFPKARTARHAGRSYVQIPIHLTIPLPRGAEPDITMAAFIPDRRTVVFGAESEIKTLLDRLAADEPSPKPPTGWQQVDRDLVAFALDNRTVPLISGKFPKGYVGGKEAQALAGSLRTLAVGLSVGDRTRVRLVATARNPTRAVKVTEGLKGFFRIAVEGFQEEEEPDELAAFGIALAKSATFEQSGRHVTGTLSADGNLVKMLLTLLRGPA